MQRKYKSGAAKWKLRVEQKKRDEQIKKKMPCLLIYGFESSSISNIKRKKPSLDKNKCGKTNKGKITSKSNCQINVAVIESEANVNVPQAPRAFKTLMADKY